jgi:hypothetical protein
LFANGEKLKTTFMPSTENRQINCDAFIQCSTIIKHNELDVLNRPQKFNVKYKREGKQAVEQYAA